MKVITVPHEILRDKTSKIATLDKKVLQLIKDLTQTITSQTHPQGVGLAAPQIGTSKQAFATYLDRKGSDGDRGPRQVQIFINPEIIDHGDDLVFGPSRRDPYLEGCLSIPGLYGPVPRFEWIELEFAQVEGSGQDAELVTTRQRFEDFAARVIQHEYDHLHGRLFTDYSLEYDLPVYQDNPKTKKLDEIDKRILEGW